MLEEYHDKQIIQFLKFGWPISHDGRKYLDLHCDNWKGAKLNPVQVSKYLLNEIEFKSVIGPFHRNPFIQKAGILPLNTHDKKDSQEKRIILDLSISRRCRCKRWDRQDGVSWCEDSMGPANG